MVQPTVSILSNLRVAGALVLDKDEADFPPGSPGMMVIKDQNLYAYITVGGLQTWYPLVRDLAASYIHTQGGPNSVWTVNHNLGVEDIWYQVQDGTGNVISPASIQKIDNNTFLVNFTEPTTGTVLAVGANQIDVPEVQASLIRIGADVRLDSSGITTLLLHVKDTMTVDKDILPSGTTQNIGSPTQPFNAVYAKDLHLSVNTLYMGDKPVLSTDNTGAIGMQGDLNQDTYLKTSGTGVVTISSAAKVDLNAPVVHVNGVQVATVTDVQAIVGSAPDALNTLQEIGAALADDANFAGTMTTQLAAKADKTTVNTALSTKVETTDIRVNNKQLDKGSVGTGTVGFLYSDRAYQKLTVTGAINVTIGGFSAAGQNVVEELEIEAVNWGSAAVNITTAVSWIKPDGTLATSLSDYLTSIGRNGLPAAGVALMYFRCANGGTIYGEVA